jgi:hypothetical protein
MGGPGEICLQGAYHTMLPWDAPTTVIDLASVLEVTTSDPTPTLWGNTVFFGKLRIGHAFVCGFSAGGGWTRQESCGRSKRSLQYRRSLCFDNAGSLL